MSAPQSKNRSIKGRPRERIDRWRTTTNRLRAGRDEKGQVTHRALCGQIPVLVFTAAHRADSAAPVTDFTVMIDDCSGRIGKKLLRARDKNLTHRMLVIGDRPVPVRSWDTPAKANLPSKQFEELDTSERRFFSWIYFCKRFRFLRHSPVHAGSAL
jgi:hypothetical protein